MTGARLGIFLCDCGDEVSSVLDMETLETGARTLPDVALVHRLPYCCSPDGLDAIWTACAAEQLDHVLVAGCTPRTLGRRFREAAEQAGLAGDRVELVDIREGCAWVHSDDPAAATAKALDLIRMGAARLALAQPLEAIHAPVSPAVLVIGGGVAGMTAALTLANAGQHVTLVERTATLGGMLRGVHTLYPDRRSAADYLQTRIQAVAHHPRIEVLLRSEVTSLSGSVGRYTVNIDPGARELEAGAIVVASGAEERPPVGLFRYDGRRVVTQLEFERELGGSALPSDVVFIQCAGQRNDAVPYCSGVCCMGALKQALQIKAANPSAAVTILFRDLYLLGEPIHEARMLEARKAGVRFVRYAPAAPPCVTPDSVEVRDASTGQLVRIPCDRVVLAAPLVPQPDASVLAHTLGIAMDENGFFPEVRYRLRPENYAQRGIYVCGASHHPGSWIEAEFQAASAALRALRYLRAGEVTSNAPVAVVDDNLCTGCGSCVGPCPFGAISLHKREGQLDLSVIDPLLCTGCGNCVVACPVKAISQPADSDAQLLAQIDAALFRASSPQNEELRSDLRILVFGCEWSGYAAAELAGARKLSYPPEVRLIRTRCSARFDPTLVLWALFGGADGVFLGACPPGECHYIDGNRFAQERFDSLRTLLGHSGFDTRRLRLEFITPDDPHDFVRKITDFAGLVRALGPSPVPGER
jgi:heterodisulfide reductase subunit A